MTGNSYDRYWDQMGITNAVAVDGGQRPDEILAALSDFRRRHILYCLQDDERASLTDIAQQVAAWKQECPPEDVSEKSIAEFKIQLYHCHLPKLQEADIVEYDMRTEMVVFRAPHDLVEMCLEYCESHDLPIDYSDS